MQTHKEEGSMIKTFILDTSVKLVHDPLSIYNFQENNIIIPIIWGLEELDNLKKKEGIIGTHKCKIVDII